MSKTTVVLADDHAIVRQGIRAVLEATSEFAVVGEVADGLQVPATVERLRPNVLILDLMMPGLNGLEITRQVRNRCPQTRVVILSMHADEAYVVEALRNGAAGYILKDASTTEVAQAVREVAAGRRYLSQPLSERAIEVYAEKAQAAPLDLYDTLTTREREVLQLCAEGYSSTEIAARLGISPRTADTHRANLMRKLGLQSQTDLVRYALRRGIVPL
jgi:two-component system, NarL family, response regulator NreC